MSKCPECGRGGSKPWKHRALMIAWGILLVPTIVWWRESIVWVVFMSWYANFVGHWSGNEAVEAGEKAENGSPGSGTPDAQTDAS